MFKKGDKVISLGYVNKVIFPNETFTVRGVIGNEVLFEEIILRSFPIDKFKLVKGEK